MRIQDATTTEELIAQVKHTLHPFGLVHVDQVMAWLNKQADITRAECLETVWANEQLEKEAMR